MASRSTGLVAGVVTIALASCGSEAVNAPTCPAAVAPAPLRMALREGWAIQSAAKVDAADADVARPGFRTLGWIPARVPSTVSGTLVDAGLYGDPFYGKNLRTLPGMDYPEGGGFGNLPMSESSPFHTPWWYRTQFQLPPEATGGSGRRYWLRLDGVNYRAAVWLNGRLLAGEDSIAGTFRDFELDVTGLVSPCDDNALAIRVRAPELSDLAWNWVDWNPFPPDKDMGLWRDVTIHSTGPVRLDAPQVQSQVAPRLDEATLTVSVDAYNASAEPVTLGVDGQIEEVRFHADAVLAPREARTLRWDESSVPALRFPKPRLWWPSGQGAQELYTLDLRATVGGEPSDSARLRFGIREMTSELVVQKGEVREHRIFSVNGRKVLVRGAGYTPDLFLRIDDHRIDDELAYVKHMGLNAIRLEGKLGLEHLYDACDELGILIVAGWCCCDHWEDQGSWMQSDYSIAGESLKSQIHKLRNHASALVWLNGSDNLPPPEVEGFYDRILVDERWPNPSVGSANSTLSSLTGLSGLKMTGPYMWVPPLYWYGDQRWGGAWGMFNTETSVGPAIPPLESLKKFIPPEHLWPIDDYWIYHSGSASFVSIDTYVEALSRRYGPSSGVEDFVAKSQLSSYEGVRAMYEAYARNRWVSTGVIQWMLDNAWPGIIWHLYDWYLKPAGGYFGAKKANEPLHIQYSYDDRSVVVVNLAPQAVPGLTARAEVVDLDGKIRFTKEAKVELPADGTVIAFTMPDSGAEWAGGKSAYLLRLRVVGPGDAIASDNVYWLSTIADQLDWGAAFWQYTPTTVYADFTSLAKLPAASVRAVFSRRSDGADEVAQATLENTGAGLAFFLRAEIVKGAGGEEALPVRWDDNYVTLLAGESRVLTARYRAADLDGAKPRLRVAGINLASSETDAAP